MSASRTSSHAHRSRRHCSHGISSPTRWDAATRLEEARRGIGENSRHGSKGRLPSRGPVQATIVRGHCQGSVLEVAGDCRGDRERRRVVYAGGEVVQW